jgi:uncharacterized protein YdcH (DUF465 family)
MPEVRALTAMPTVVGVQRRPPDQRRFDLPEGDGESKPVHGGTQQTQNNESVQSSDDKKKKEPWWEGPLKIALGVLGILTVVGGGLYARGRHLELKAYNDVVSDQLGQERLGHYFEKFAETSKEIDKELESRSEAINELDKEIKELLKSSNQRETEEIKEKKEQILKLTDDLKELVRSKFLIDPDKPKDQQAICFKVVETKDGLKLIAVSPMTGSLEEYKSSSPQGNSKERLTLINAMHPEGNASVLALEKGEFDTEENGKYSVNHPPGLDRVAVINRDGKVFRVSGNPFHPGTIARRVSIGLRGGLTSKVA